MKAISPKPPKIQTANGTAICWGHDVIECEDCRETITWCSRCVEESSLRLAVKQSQFSEFLPFFPRRYCIYSLSFMEALIKIATRLDPTTFCVRCTIRLYAEPFHERYTVCMYAVPFYITLSYFTQRYTICAYAVLLDITLYHLT